MQVEPRPLYNRIEQEQKYHLQASIFFYLIRWAKCQFSQNQCPFYWLGIAFNEINQIETTSSWRYKGESIEPNVKMTNVPTCYDGDEHQLRPICRGSLNTVVDIVVIMLSMASEGESEWSCQSASIVETFKRWTRINKTGHRCKKLAAVTTFTQPIWHFNAATDCPYSNYHLVRYDSITNRQLQ